MNTQRTPKSPYIKAVRPMAKTDIESLREPSARVRINKLSDSHHMIARLTVSGLSLAEIAAETGYTITRISVLRNTPSMQELIAKYRANEDDSWRKARDATNEYMHRVRMKALRIVEDHLDDEETPPTPTFALKAFDSMADRTNYHRKSTKENINIDFAARLEAAITKSNQVKYIDHES